MLARASHFGMSGWQSALGRLPGRRWGCVNHCSFEIPSGSSPVLGTISTIVDIHRRRSIETSKCSRQSPPVVWLHIWRPQTNNMLPLSMRWVSWKIWAQLKSKVPGHPSSHAHSSPSCLPVLLQSVSSDAQRAGGGGAAPLVSQRSGYLEASPR